MRQRDHACIFLLVFFLGFSSVSSGQSYQTFRAQQAISQQRPANVPGADTVPAKPHPFLGWNYTAKADKEYQRYFQRPRAGLARARVAAGVSAGGPAGPTHKLAGAASFPALALRSSMPAGFIPDSVATGDFNHDGKTDWVVANGGDNDLWVYFGNGDGTASIPTIVNLSGLGPVAVATADLRRNGKIDIIVSEIDSNTLEVFLGNGNGTFQPSVVYSLTGPPTFVAVADYNKDGIPDLAVAMLGTSPIAFLPGRGNGTFGQPVLNTWGVGGTELISLAPADLNHDGNMDLVYTDFANGIGYVLGNGDGTWGSGQLVAGNIDVVGLQYFASAVGDVNEDGCPDIVATDSFAFAEVYPGHCDGTFGTFSLYGAGDIGVSVVLQDLDGDGHLDIVTAGDYFGNIIFSGDDAGNLLSVLKGDGTGSFATASVFRGQPGMYSLAFLNLNGASVPSVLAVNEENDLITLFVNDGTGDFGAPRGRAIGYQGPAVSNSPYGGFLASDVNGDGLPDLLSVALPPGSPGMLQLSTILNQGNGKFGTPSRSSLYPDSAYVPGDMAAGDFRNTGLSDVIVVGSNSTFSSPVLAFAANSGNGTFAPAVVTTPSAAAGLIGVGDFNRDGKLDFVTLNAGSQGQTLNVFLGHGDGTFTAQPAVVWGGRQDRWPLQVYVGDYNGDGKLDVMVHLYENVVPFSVNDVYVFYGNGDGTFPAPVEIFSNLDPFTVADLNHDGIPDIVTCKQPEDNYPDPNTPAQTSVVLGVAGGGFGNPTTYATYPGYAVLPDEVGDAFHQGLCPVADFNGDGNLDIGVFEADGFFPYPYYVQFLSGNGDGTFTPTYNIYSFARRTVPQEWFDLNQDGKADFLEMDGLTSSFNFVPGTTAQAFQLETVTEPITGDTGVAQVSLNVPAASDTVFTLQASDPGLQLPGTVTVPAGSVSQQFSYTVTNQANVHRVFRITASLGSEQESAYNFVLTDHRVGTGFSFTLQWPSQEVYPGLTSTDFQPRYSSQVNYETTLNVSCSGLPVGLTCAFTPASPTLVPNSALNGSMVINAENGVAPGSYNFEATASDTNSSVTVPATIMVLPPTPILNVSGPFRLYGIVGTAVPAVLTIKNIGDEPGHNVVATLSNNAKELKLSALTSSSGTCSLSSMSCSLGTLNQGDSVTVSVTQILLTSGDLQFGVDATDSEHSRPAGLGVDIFAADYSLSLSTTSLTVNPGSQGNVTVNLEPLGIQGFDDSISLSCSGLPTGATCSFSPASVTLGMSQGTSVLTITIPQASAAIPHPRLTHPSRALFALLVAPFGVVVFVTPRKRSTRGILLGVLFGAVLLLQSCGGGGGSSSGTTGGGSGGTGGTGGGGSAPPPPNYSVKVTAVGAGDQHSATLALTVP